MKEESLSDLLQKLKSLKNIRVPLAEFEYLYDPEGINEGQIDPNALSAGGFPFYLTSGVLSPTYESLTKPKNLKDSEINLYLAQKLSECFSEKFGLSGEKLTAALETATSQFQKILCYKIDKDLVDLLVVELNCFDTEVSIEGPTGEILAKIFENEFTLSFLNSAFWIRHRLNVIDTAYTSKPNEMQEIDAFVDSYLNGMGLLNPKYETEPSVLSDYKVFWESDLGYLIKYKLEKIYPKLTVNVWIDLHVKTGLFSLSPLKAFTSLLSKSKQSHVYELVRNFTVEETDNIYILKNKSENFPEIEYYRNTGKAFCRFGENSVLELKDTKHTLQTITPEYNQYAYLFDTYPTDKIDFTKKCDQLMYLSSLLNAKSALFKIYELMETEQPFVVRRPYTKTCDESTIGYEHTWNMFTDGKIVIKEGGKCSTGGTEVQILTKTKVGENIYSPYVKTVVQSYVPSYIFKLNGTPVHGHCRKLSVLDAKGAPVHLGFVFKLSYKPNDQNSSAFVTIPMFFDEGGGFVLGQFTGKNDESFTKMASVGLQLNVTEDEFQNLLRKVKDNWLISIYFLNKYFDEDFTGASRNLFIEGCLDDKYAIPAIQIAQL